MYFLLFISFISDIYLAASQVIPMYCRPSILGQYIGTYIKCLLIEWLWWSKQQSIWSFLPFFSKLKAKLKREQFEKEKRRLACRARRAPKQKRSQRERRKNWKGTWVFLSIWVQIFKDHLFPLPPADIASRLLLYVL